MLPKSQELRPVARPFLYFHNVYNAECCLVLCITLYFLACLVFHRLQKTVKKADNNIYLELVLDNKLTIKYHADNAYTKVFAKSSILRRLAGSMW